MESCKQNKKEEGGAIVIEATISLTAFIFAIFTILSVVNICFIQARINMALNSAAKDISQYTYLYYLFSLDEVQEGWYDDVKDENALAKETIDNMAGLMGLLDSANDAANDLQEGTATSDQFTALYDDLKSCGGNMKSLVTKYKEMIGDDPKQFIFGMAKMAGTEIVEEVKVFLAQLMAQVFMEKNLVAGGSDTADTYLRRYNVKDGVDGLDFNYSTLMAYGESDKIQLCVTYEVEVVKILNIDYSFKIRQVTQTTSWGNGVSLIEENEEPPTVAQEKGETVWDMPSYVNRGKYIVAQEKTKYKYTTKSEDKRGFDAYDDSANQFVTIISINTHDKSYNTKLTAYNKAKSSIKSYISKSYQKTKKQVKDLDETITLSDSSKGGAESTVTSDKDTRKYKIVVVVPDDADGTLLNEVKEALLDTYPDDLEIVFVDGYGIPTPESEKETETETETSKAA